MTGQTIAVLTEAYQAKKKCLTVTKSVIAIEKKCIQINIFLISPRKCTYIVGVH